MLPKRRFWKDEQKTKCGFSTDFSMVRSPTRELTPQFKCAISPKLEYSRMVCFIVKQRALKLRNLCSPHCSHCGEQKSRTFSPRSKVVSKTQIRIIDNNKSNNLGVFMHPNDYNSPFNGLFMNFSTQIIACCAYRCSYLRFSYPFRPRAESATFLFATMPTSGRVHLINPT